MRATKFIVVITICAAILVLCWALRDLFAERFKAILEWKEWWKL